MSDKKEINQAVLAQNRAEIAIERANLTHEAIEAELDAAYGDNPRSENTKANSTSNQTDWEYLRSVAKAEFPEGKNISGLSPDNRLVAIASCLGWSVLRINKASGKSRTTIDKWLARPDIKLFMNEFNMKRGENGVDVMQKFSALEYMAVKCVERILSDPDNSDSTRRLQLDASKWAFDRNRGKSEQKVELRGTNIRQLISVMANSAKTIALTDSEEQDLFAIEGSVE